MTDSVFHKISDTSQSIVTGRPSLAILLGNRRSTRRLTLSFSSRKKYSSSRSLNIHEPIKLEPTYRIQPCSKIPFQAIKSAVLIMLKNRLANITYDAKKAALLSQVLSDEIKNEVKSFGVNRYKIIVQTLLGSASNRSVSFVAKSLWNPEFDNYLTLHHGNESMFITASVYFVYQE